MKRHITKRRVIVTTIAAFALTAGVAFAYFSSVGSGTGSAKSGTVSNLTITQIGAGYDSLIANNGYHQDQCFSCAGVTEIGNDVTLANPGGQQLVSAVVAMDNWNQSTVSDVPITVSMNNGPNGPVSDTVTPTLAAGTGGGPTTTNVVFDFSTQNAWVYQEFVYGITFPTSGDGGGLNVALSSSATNLSVGSNTSPGHIYLNDSEGPINEFPTCATPLPTTGFESVYVDCGPWNLGNPGAYGNEGAASADIPAVEFNVVGGTVAALYPGGPALPIEFAITNPGSSGSYVTSVTTSISSVTTNADIPTCSALWYSLSPSTSPYQSATVAIGENILPGTTFFDATGESISMPTNNSINQDSCEGNTVNLSFSSN